MQSEYLQEGDERLGFISGFTGSNGVALISPSEALVWTDSRYFLQAPKELTEGWHMKKMTKSDPTWFEYIANNYKKEDTVIGIDARLISTGSYL
jgi:Xaa-Pro aminopeptidase